jgi:hypothetical protein
MYEKFFKRYVEFMEKALGNEEILNHLGQDFVDGLKAINAAIDKIGGLSKPKRKILKMCSTKELLDFLSQQAIEFIYWIIIIILAFSLPKGIGAGVFIVATALSIAQDHYNNGHKNVVIDIIDSLICIFMYVAVLIVI